MATETSTQYAVKGTAAKHGRWQVIVQTDPLHETDRARVAEAVEEQRYWQAEAGLTPDAELVYRTWDGDGWTDWRPWVRPEDATTTEQLQDALNPFVFWSASTPELAERHRQVLAAAGNRPTPDCTWRTQIYAEISESGTPSAWVVTDAATSRVIPFEQARGLLTNNWADLVRCRPYFIPES